MFLRCLLYASALLLVSCARPAHQEQGWASCIADQYAGMPTTSGQPYYPQAFTAAHTSLPFGTQCEVTNIQTGRKVTVVVNDRFPYYPGRVINLSHAAAQYIGLPYTRLCQVKVKSYPPSGGGSYSQQPTYPQQPPSYYQQSAPTYRQPQQQQSYAAAQQKRPATNKTQAPRAATPRYAAPNQAAQTYRTPTYNVPRPIGPPVGGAPNAAAFGGGAGSPSGLKTF